MPTRIYCHTGAPPLTPTTWIFPNVVATPVTIPGTTTQNTGLAMTSKTDSTLATGVHTMGMGRVVIGPLATQTISGTVYGQMRGMESATQANAQLAVAIKLVQPDGTDRAVLLGVTASDATTAAVEFSATTLTNRPFQTVTESLTLTLTDQTATAGDFLVIEWGFRASTGTVRTITLSYGNDSASDLPIAESTDTQPFNPWWEFSQTLTFGEAVPSVTATESLPLVTLVTMLVPLLPLSASSAVGLLSTVTLGLSPLRPAATDAVALSDTSPVALLLAPLTLSTSIGLSDTPTVMQTAEGARAVGPLSAALAVTDAPTLRLPLLSAAVLTALGLLDAPTVHVPVLSLATTASLTLGTLPTVQIPLLRLAVTATLGVNASAAVVRTVEGLLQVGQVLEVLAPATTVALRLPVLPMVAGSSLTVGALPTMHIEVGTLHPDTTVALATTVTLHLPLAVQASETLPVQAISAMGGTSVFLTTTTVGLGTTVTLALRLHVPSAESLALGTQVTLHLPLALQASEGVTLGETLTLTGVLRLTSTSALSLLTTTDFSVGLLTVQASEVLPLTATPWRMTGLSLRGVHAQSPALRQAVAADPTLEQAEMEDAILV